MNKHSIVNLKCPCFLFRYPKLDIPSQALFNLHRASSLPLGCGSEDDQNVQNPTGHSRRPVTRRRYHMVSVCQGEGLIFITLNSSHWTLCIVHCAMNSTYSKQDTRHFRLHTAHFTLHIAHCTLITAHCTLHTAQCTLYMAHYTVKPRNYYSPQTIGFVRMLITAPQGSSPSEHRR